MARDLWQELCSIENLERAFKKARKHKTLRPYVIEFEKNLAENFTLLRIELLLHSYRPKPLETFILRDPKTRKISKSDFRDRVIHHALCNVIEPIFEKCFISDSYANRRGKGSLKAIKLFELFARRVSWNHTRNAFVLKADIKHYFENVDHQILLDILKKKIKDALIIWLIKIILFNHSEKKGMPLGNLTSQFFANIYLNELDRFVKHKLRAEYYIRYVDDFVILHNSKEILENWRIQIGMYLQSLKLELHPNKTKIIILERGTEFLGFKLFHYFRLLKRRNRRKFNRNFWEICHLYYQEKIPYDEVYDFLEGWLAYAKNANTFRLRKEILLIVEKNFPHEISRKEVNRGI